MKNIEELKGFLAEEFGIHSEADLLNAISGMEKPNIGMFAKEVKRRADVRSYVPKVISVGHKPYKGWSA